MTLESNLENLGRMKDEVSAEIESSKVLRTELEDEKKQVSDLIDDKSKAPYDVKEQEKLAKENELFQKQLTKDLEEAEHL